MTGRASESAGEAAGGRPSLRPVGDGEGSTVTFRRIYPALRRFAAVIAPLDLDPDDLVQEAVARVLRGGSLDRLDQPTAYLRRTMTNVVSNHNRSRGRERRAVGRLRDPVSAAPDYPSDLTDLDRLDPLDRAAVFLADVERLPLAEVAAALDLSTLATRARVSRARRRLRSALSSDPSSHAQATPSSSASSPTGDLS